MPEDDLAHDLDRRPGPAGISGRMSSEIMRADFKTDFSARFFDNLLGARNPRKIKKSLEF